MFLEESVQCRRVWLVTKVFIPLTHFSYIAWPFALPSKKNKCSTAENALLSLSSTFVPLPPCTYTETFHYAVPRYVIGATFSKEIIWCKISTEEIAECRVGRLSHTCLKHFMIQEHFYLFPFITSLHLFAGITGVSFLSLIYYFVFYVNANKWNCLD